MLSMLKNWKGSVEINGTVYDSIEEAIKIDSAAFSTGMHIILHSASKNGTQSATVPSQRVSTSSDKAQYRITVKSYMTKQATPSFDFMLRWNNDRPMPLRTMTGTVEKETRGMVYMKLHGDIYAEKVCTCMKCGKALTNPVSQYFGIGPECGDHNYVNPFSSKEELKEAVSAYRKRLQNIQWEGWVVKSAITEQETV